MGMLEEIREQPVVVERALELNVEAARSVASLFGRCTHVVIAARGTSDNAARYAQYAWGTRNGISVGLTTPSLFSIYDRPPRLTDALVVGISQSGQSPDIVSVLREGRLQNRPTVALTNDTDSPLAQTADVVLDLAAGEEKAVAATKTYTSELAVVALISAMMGGAISELGSIPDAIATVLEQEPMARTAAAHYSEMEHCAVLGRGLHQATAFEWALKLQELTYVVAQPFSTADFLHGPIAVLEPGYPVLAAASAGPPLGDVHEVLARCRDVGASVLAISADRAIEDVADHTLSLVPDIAEWLDPIQAIVAGQLFAYHLTLAKGLDPEKPRGLKKVTRTT